MITGKQIRAARVLLDWDAKDLASKSELSLDTIFKVENGFSQARGGTIDKIVQTFAIAGIEFIDNDGVRRRPHGVEVFEGADRFNEFYDFLYEHVKKFGGDICLSISDERLLTQYRKDPEAHYKRMQDLSDRKGFRSFRILANKSNFASKYSYNTYKWQPEESIAPTAFYTFGDCLALISFAHDPAPYVVMLQSAPIAQSFRQAFDLAWNAGKEPLAKADTKS